MGLRRFAMVLAALAIGCGGSSAGAPTPAAGLTPTVVHIGILGSASDAGIVIADALGYFKEEGVVPDYQRFQSGANMTAPLGTGQIDVGAGAPSAGLFNAMARDIQIKIVADKGNVDPPHGFEAFLVRKQLIDSGQVRSVADLKGRRVAISATGIPPEFELDTMLRTAGLTVKDVTVVTLSFPDMVTALQNGAIDMAGVIEPFSTVAQTRGLGVVFKRADEIIPGNQLSLIMYSTSFAKQTDLARRWMRAYLRGVRDFNDIFFKKTAPQAKKDAVIKALIKDTSVTDPTLWDKMVMPNLDPNGRVRIDKLKASQDWFVQMGYQQRKVDLDKALDTSYATWAVQKLGPYK